MYDPYIRRVLKKRSIGRTVSRDEGSCDAPAMSGMIAGRCPCGIIPPLVDRYPECIIEIVAPVHLEEALRVKDGDKVEVEPFSNTGG